MAAKMEPKSSPPSKGGISRLKVVFFFSLLPLGAIVGGVVDFFLCKRGGEARKEGFSANEKKAWRKIWCGFFFQCGCNGHGAQRFPPLRVAKIWAPFLLPLRQKWKQNPPPLRPPTRLSDHEATPHPRYAITSQSRIQAIIGAVDTLRRLETIQAI